MAGHSHSSNIKFRKDRVDAARAKAFSKMAKMIAVAAKMGGGDPDGNPRLRLAMDKARLVNMPKDNIQRAIKKGTGEGSDANYEELIYEGYGPAGVAVMLEILTEKRSRTAPEVRKLFEKGGGSLGETNTVAYMFERKAVFEVEGRGVDEAKLMEIVLESGAEDLVKSGEDWEVHAEASDFSDVQIALEAADVRLTGGEVAYLPANRIDMPDASTARKVLRLVESLDDHDDVQSVHSNYAISDEIYAELEKDDA